MTNGTPIFFNTLIFMVPSTAYPALLENSFVSRVGAHCCRFVDLVSNDERCVSGEKIAVEVRVWKLR